MPRNIGLTNVSAKMRAISLTRCFLQRWPSSSLRRRCGRFAAHLESRPLLLL